MNWIEKGFSLIELMVVVAIVGIISAIAYPSYQGYTCDTYRSQAVADMRLCALALDRYYSNDFTYVGAFVNDGTILAEPTLCVSQSPASGTARFVIDLPTPATLNDYTIRSAPATGQTCGGTVQITADGTLTEL